MDGDRDAVAAHSAALDALLDRKEAALPSLLRRELELGAAAQEAAQAAAEALLAYAKAMEEREAFVREIQEAMDAHLAALQALADPLLAINLN